MKNEKRIDENIGETIAKISSVLRPEVIQEISSQKRLITGKTYEEEPYLLTQSESTLRKVSDENTARIKKQMFEEASEKGSVTFTMFTCPNVNAQYFSTKAEETMPVEFDSNQILFQRLPLLLYLH